MSIADELERPGPIRLEEGGEALAAPWRVRVAGQEGAPVAQAGCVHVYISASAPASGRINEKRGRAGLPGGECALDNPVPDRACLLVGDRRWNKELAILPAAGAAAKEVADDAPTLLSSRAPSKNALRSGAVKWGPGSLGASGMSGHLAGSRGGTGG